MRKSLNELIESSIKENWERAALTDFKGVTYQYKDVARKIEKIHILFEAAGIEKGDKISICGRNSAHWAVAFLGTLTYGAVAVPILHDFKPDNVHHIVKHSGSKLLFVGDMVWENLNEHEMKQLKGIILINDFSVLASSKATLSKAREHLNELFGKKYPSRFGIDDIRYHIGEREELALINYTSGSTGFSKGVMLPYRSLTANIQFCHDSLAFLQSGDGTVSMLPMAHMYGLATEMLNPFTKGCHIHFLTRTPSPKVIMDAFAEVKPKLIIGVPLILEKIIKTRVFPLLEKPLIRLMMMVPFVDTQLLHRVKEKLNETFGGNLVEFVIGGASLNKEVEEFLRKIDFPYTVGYGMTECGPLITFSPWDECRAQSCGRVVDSIALRVDSSDPQHIPGELHVRGDNVMLGYYDNPEATAQVMNDEGWLNTGDMGIVDQDGYVFIRGRSKNMILGSSGQNIYPEEIEDKLNNMPFVSESLIVDQDGKLVALIYPDIENTNAQGMLNDQIEKQMEENRVALNNILPAYSQIVRVKLYYEEFEKTPKRSIKRYLYQKI